jgi:hypothetical protein
VELDTGTNRDITKDSREEHTRRMTIAPYTQDMASKTTQSSSMDACTICGIPHATEALVELPRLLRFSTAGEMEIIPGDPTDGAGGTVPVCNRGDECTHPTMLMGNFRNKYH